MANAPESVNAAIVRVSGGRGFVIESGNPLIGRVILTCAHCLPELPPPMAASHTEERTYAKLIGPVGGAPAIWCECLFADPVSDAAVLGAPDGQQLLDECLAFESLVDAVEHTVPIGSIAEVAEMSAWLRALDGSWITCIAHVSGRGMWLTDLAAPIEGGMSGSPILTSAGAAIGIVGIGTDGGAKSPQGPQVRIPHALPAWLVNIQRAGV